MKPVYEFAWQPSQSPIGIGYYLLHAGGQTKQVTDGTTARMTFEPGQAIRAELIAVDHIGQQSDPAVVEFTAPTYDENPPPPPPERPTPPGGFSATHVSWE